MMKVKEFCDTIGISYDDFLNVEISRGSTSSDICEKIMCRDAIGTPFKQFYNAETTYTIEVSISKRNKPEFYKDEI